MFSPHPRLVAFFPLLRSVAACPKETGPRYEVHKDLCIHQLRQPRILFSNSNRHRNLKASCATREVIHGHVSYSSNQQRHRWRSPHLCRSFRIPSKPNHLSLSCHTSRVFPTTLLLHRISSQPYALVVRRSSDSIISISRKPQG